MNKSKQKRLKAAGWKVGSTKEFLDLSDQEVAYIELKLQLAKDLQKKRRERNLTQIEFARRIQSSQSRVAKMEAGDPTVSMDLLIRSLLALGATPKHLQKYLPQ
ncbi:MAG: transcriptional regulator [Ignavibacteria bacterium GWA2_55_11]|nr:MAG: transcriptional regulator [Ignavibacteria bacterium GWA2_55_11]OGU44740.1 MAG: transcriptional regulator [Ignavibacteria bacterium GWC2_56_12]OGU69240.1 MAG: transcriptional regulator [Ignavibacteria bacterium RIFCSPLOWO2_02_FULL_55_14]